MNGHEWIAKSEDNAVDKEACVFLRMMALWGTINWNLELIHLDSTS